MPSRLAALLRRDPRRDAVHRVYERIVERARHPIFYAELGVPDSVDGRFELIALHAFLVLHRLKAEPGEAKAFGQALFDLMFADFDRSLRELGTGDLSVGKEVRRMAEAFYGRAAAYESGLAGGTAALGEALRRNLYGTAGASPDRLARVAGYVPQSLTALRHTTLAALLAGDADFGPLP